MNRLLKNQKVAMLIDADTLEIHASERFDARVNYEKLIQEVSPYRAIYFKPQAQLCNGWEKVLRGWGYEIQPTIGNSDSWLIMAAVSLADKCDTIILAAGDKHFLPLIPYLKSKGVKIVVWCWPGTTSAELRKSADEFISLTEKFLIGKPNNTMATLIAA